MQTFKPKGTNKEIEYLPKDLRKAGIDVHRALQANFPETANKVTKEIQWQSVARTGKFKSAWSNKLESDTGTTISYAIYNTADYATILEEGNIPGTLPWKSTGHRTAKADGRIWSSSQVGGAHSHVDIQGAMNDLAIQSLKDALL